MLLAETMAMLTSGEYTLAKKNGHERKSIFFVKLTDSAQRALSNYLRCLESSCEVPIIEFNNDEGRLSIPTSPKQRNTDNDQYMAQFKFDVISNDTMQGKQGRFECVQQKRGSRQLIKYGQLTQRLRIHANEDVYETTKNRMAAIELQQRKNCTVQLDWNSTTKTSSLNRKLKLTPKGFPTNHKHDDMSSLLSSSSKPVPKLEVSNMIRNKSRPVNNAPPKKINPAACIIRKPLKERIIHLLAVRPYKRPELESALKKDGLRDCDKSHIMDTLMSVSNFRDNMYHLSKHAWNDVQEDWLFYTEYERQQIRKNKLQNLTSPSSSSDSGVSVSSNHSPNNNTHVGDKSPPQSYKRPGYFNGVDGFQTKRQRISHFVKQDPIKSSSSSSSSSMNNSVSVGASAAAAVLIDDGVPLSQTTYQQQQPQQPHHHNNNNNNINHHHHRSSDEFHNKTAAVKQEFKPSPQTKNYTANASAAAAVAAAATATTNTSAAAISNFTADARSTHHLQTAADSKWSPSKEPLSSSSFSGNNYGFAHSQSSSVDAATSNSSSSLTSASFTTVSSNGTKLEDEQLLKQTLQQQPPYNFECERTQPNPAQMVADLNSSRGTLDKKYPYEKPKYMKDYVTITNTEQRSRYKADFSKIFEEYERVHKEVDQVRNLFAQLGESLKKHKKGSKGYAKVENDIFKKYYALKSNRNFQDAKRRYEYLHEKLSHIKNLVNEYDDQVRKQQMCE